MRKESTRKVSNILIFYNFDQRLEEKVAMLLRIMNLQHPVGGLLEEELAPKLKIHPSWMLPILLVIRMQMIIKKKK